MESERKRRWEQLGLAERRSSPKSHTGWEHFSCSLGSFPAGVDVFISFGGCPWGPQIVLVDDRECLVGKTGQGDAPLTPPTPVDLDLDWVLGKMPQKVCEPGRGVCCAVVFLAR